MVFQAVCSYSHVHVQISDFPGNSLANVAGTQEPEYGPSAIQSVADQAKDTPYTEVTSKDLTWKAMESTCVETQTFYFMADEGTVAWAQIIYSNVGLDSRSTQLTMALADTFQGHKNDLPV